MKITKKIQNLLNISEMAPVLSNEFLDIQATTESRFTLKRVYGMIKTH